MLKYLILYWIQLNSLFFGGAMQKEEKVHLKLRLWTECIYILPLYISFLVVSLHTFKILLCLFFDLLSDVVQRYIL